MLAGYRSKMRRIWYYIPEPCKSVIYILAIITLSPKMLFGQNVENTSYREVFGDKYSCALRYLDQQWIQDTLFICGQDPCFAKSVVFPEVIRYSSIHDEIQLQALYTLYVQYGKQYADFSVGQFQMKPSFAEQVEKDAYTLSILKNNKNLLQIDTSATPQSRLARIKRLNNPAWQLLYVIWFIKVTENRFKAISWKSETEKIKFIATAYNSGYNRTPDYIFRLSAQKRFYTTLFKSSHCYNYADICHEYYRNCSIK